VTQATGWQGGGGFRYYELAPTLLATDRWGNLVINPEYDAAMLSEAMCKLGALPTRPARRCGGSTATAASATLST
jgi:adenine-specific DNA-methyltransferase